MDRSSNAYVHNARGGTRSVDLGKLAVYVSVLLLLLLGGDLLRRVLRMVRPTTAAVAAARREDRAPVQRQATRVRLHGDKGVAASRPQEPSRAFFAAVDARLAVKSAPDSTALDDSSGARPDEDEVLSGMAMSGALRDISAWQRLQLMHPTDGADHMAPEQRPSPEDLETLRQAGGVIR